MTADQKDAAADQNRSGQPSGASGQSESGQSREFISGDHGAGEAAEAALESDSGAADDAAAGGPAVERDVEAELAAAREELNELRDNSLRVRAEMENIRRRSQNEVISARKFAIEGFAQELLEVKDSLDLAAQVELTDHESEAVVRMQEGLALTLKQLDATLSKFAVNEVEAAEGVKFNPEVHQAISMVESDRVESNHIISVMQKGFTLKERLLRPAMVVVAS